MDSASGTVSRMKVSNIASFLIQSIEYTFENMFKKKAKEKKPLQNLKTFHKHIHCIHARQYEKSFILGLFVDETETSQKRCISQEPHPI